MTPPAHPPHYTLSLHDALPICRDCGRAHSPAADTLSDDSTVGIRACHSRSPWTHPTRRNARQRDRARSEEHTSELQSQSNLVCRLLLEKKKMTQRIFRITFPILTSLLVRLVVLLPFQMLLLALATHSRLTLLALSIFLH